MQSCIVFLIRAYHAPYKPLQVYKNKKKNNKKTKTTRTTQCGIYSFSVTFTSVELGCSEEEVRALLAKFISYGKILYDEEHEEIMRLNWYKYNLNMSRNTLICVNRELEDVKNKEFVRRFYELCKTKKYPLDIIFSGIDVGEAIDAEGIKEEVK